jgi:hypothetical protein
MSTTVQSEVGTIHIHFHRETVSQSEIRTVLAIALRNALLNLTESDDYDDSLTDFGTYTRAFIGDDTYILHGLTVLPDED